MNFLRVQIRGVAQSGLEYASGGRVVASSNLVTPTEEKALREILRPFSFFILITY